MQPYLVVTELGIIKRDTKIWATGKNNHRLNKMFSLKKKVRCSDKYRRENGGCKGHCFVIITGKLSILLRMINYDK